MNEGAGYGLFGFYLLYLLCGSRKKRKKKKTVCACYFALIGWRLIAQHAISCWIITLPMSILKFAYRNNCSAFRTHLFCQHMYCLCMVTWLVPSSSIMPHSLVGFFSKQSKAFETISKHLKENKELRISDLPEFQLSPASVCESSLQLVREKQPNSENWDKFNHRVKKGSLGVWSR